MTGESKQEEIRKWIQSEDSDDRKRELLVRIWGKREVTEDGER